MPSFILKINRIKESNRMQFSNFTRVEDGTKITFSTSSPLVGITNIKYYQDNSSGSFSKKEFRWSFNNDYWSSWENLNQGNISGINIKDNINLFLEIRYVLAGNGKVTSFTLNYEGVAQVVSDVETCPPDSNYIPANKNINNEIYIVNKCHDNELINANTLCGKSCEYYLWRPNQKGEQSISTITDLQKILVNLTGSIQNSITDASTVGSGIGVFYDKVGKDLLFKSIDVSGGLAISETPEGLITLTTASGGAQDPSISELFVQDISIINYIQDISIYIDAKFISLDSSINELYQLDASSIKGVSNIGGGPGEIFKQINSNVAELRTIVAGNANVVVTIDGDQIKISLDASVSGAPVWTDPIPVSADVGGINPGDILDPSALLNSIDILEDILYEYFPPNVNMFLDASLSYYEKWVDQPTVIISGNFNNDNFIKALIHDASIYVNGIGNSDSSMAQISYSDVSSGNFNWYDGSPPYGPNWDNVIYTTKIYHKVNSIEMAPAEASAEIRFVNPYTWGVVDDVIDVNNIDSSIIEYLITQNKLIVPKQSNEIDFIRPLGITKAKFVYAFDASYGDLKSIFDVKNDFNVLTSFDSTIINITHGATSGLPYKVYIKEHWIDVSTFKLKFNI